jgi:hypothetical protein
LLFITENPARLRRNEISEYLPQRRKGGEVRRLRVKLICKRFSLFPITLAPLREKYPIPIVFRPQIICGGCANFKL